MNLLGMLQKDISFAIKVDAFGARVPYMTQEHARNFFENALPPG